MLVMRRRAGESLLIDAETEIEVLEVCGTYVKLGIVAPDRVLIQRKEAKATRDENISAARSVRQHAVSSILSKVAPGSTAASVKKLTATAAESKETTCVLPKKY